MAQRTFGGLLALLSLALSACGSADEAATPPDQQGAAPPAATASPAADPSDAMAAGTGYHATASLVCILNGEVIRGGCTAGVKRGWTDDGGSVVEITKPDGSQRAIFTDAIGNPLGADSSEADGSAGWTMVITRAGTTSVIDFGPEHYELPDAFVLGG
jgi:hypothetical protein